MGVRFSEKGVKSEGGKRERKTAISDNRFENFLKLIIFKSRRPL